MADDLGFLRGVRNQPDLVGRIDEFFRFAFPHVATFVDASNLDVVGLEGVTDEDDAPAFRVPPGLDGLVAEFLPLVLGGVPGKGLIFLVVVSYIKRRRHCSF